MVNCDFCDEATVLPYTCNLCKKRFCSKHRLPEAHECVNIGIYKTKEYVTHKLKKKSNLRTSSFVFDDTPSADVQLFNRPSWSTGNNYYDVIIGGVVLGFTALISSRFNEFNAYFVILWSLIYAIIGMLFVYSLRNAFAKSKSISTRFVLFPIGIAITLITSLFLTLLVFGFYINDSFGKLKEEALTGLVTIFSYLGLYFIGLSLIYYVDLPIDIILGLIIVNRLFLWLAAFSILPWGNLDGSKIYNWDRRVFWPILIVVILLILNNSNFFN